MYEGYAAMANEKQIENKNDDAFRGNKCYLFILHIRRKYSAASLNLQEQGYPKLDRNHESYSTMETVRDRKDRV